jgi:hypothetical protein
LARKQEILAQLPAHYRQMRDTRWNGFAGYDEFFLSPWNNARIAAMAAYQDDVPAFEALLASEGGDLPRFFARVKALARLDPGEREQALAALLQPAPPATPTSATPMSSAPPPATPTPGTPTSGTPTPATPTPAAPTSATPTPAMPKPAAPKRAMPTPEMP